MSDDSQTIIVIATDLQVPRRLTEAGITEHWCEHSGCQKWGSFGFDKRYGTEWYCGEHRADGER